MAFYDFDLKGQVEKKHELWDINETKSLGLMVFADNTPCETGVRGSTGERFYT